VPGGGVASGTIVNFGGEQEMASGGVAVDAVINDGGLQVVGTQFDPGGTAIGTELNSNGLQSVGQGGIAISTIVNNGGEETVLSGGTASATMVNSGGDQGVASGGTAIGTIVTSGGLQQIGVFPGPGGPGGGSTMFSGANGLAISTTINSGGLEEIFAGGVAELTSISGGTEELNSGGILGSGTTFIGTGGALLIDGTDMPTAAVLGFRPGDTIDLTNVPFDIAGSVTLTSGNVVQITENNQTYDLNFDPAQDFAGWHFSLSSDNGGGTDIRLAGQRDDFNFDRTSDIAFRNDSSGDTAYETISNGAFAGWNNLGGSNTAYGVAGVGDFYGTGSSDILLRSSSTGDTWFASVSNGVFVSVEWHQIGGSDTHYSVAGVGDLYGNGTDDILYRNDSTGDIWFEAISNGAFNGWHQVSSADTNYSVAGLGDFYGNGTDDILFRNNSTGDTWIEAISNGAFDGWHQIGGSDTHYSVAGIGDFFGNGTDDILFRNAATGDTWIEQISNGAFKSWQQVGGSDTNYAVAGWAIISQTAPTTFSSATIRPGIPGSRLSAMAASTAGTRSAAPTRATASRREVRVWSRRRR
jgi:autotransporter passenger strand-loop-strand repeat protein